MIISTFSGNHVYDPKLVDMQRRRIYSAPSDVQAHARAAYFFLRAMKDGSKTPFHPNSFRADLVASGNNLLFRGYGAINGNQDSQTPLLVAAYLNTAWQESEYTKGDQHARAKCIGSKLREISDNIKGLSKVSDLVHDEIMKYSQKVYVMQLSDANLILRDF